MKKTPIRPKVARFEDDFKAYQSAPHAVAVNSCTADLHLSTPPVHFAGRPCDMISLPALAYYIMLYLLQNISAVIGRVMVPAGMVIYGVATRMLNLDIRPGRSAW